MKAEPGAPLRRFYYEETTWKARPTLSPDGAQACVSVQSFDMAENKGLASLWLFSAFGGAPRQLTSAGEKDAEPRWSPDGRWIAFGAGDTDDHTQPVETVFGVNLVDTETGAVRVLPSGRPVSDLAWSPDGTKLALADGGIAVYSLATGEVRHLIDGTRVQTLDWSPDGRRIAFDRVDPAAIPPPEPAVSDARQLAVIDADGTDERIIASGYHANQGIGPVWSPDGNRIVYQRVCDRRTLPAGVPYTCREAHEVVVASLDQTAGQGVTQVLIPPPETADAGGSTVWWPFYVTWSPDGETLLYQAWPDPTLPRCDVNQGCIALLAVLADGNGTATILTGDLEVGLDREPGVPTQSWGRQPPD